MRDADELIQLAERFRASLRHAVYLSRSLDRRGELTTMQASTLNMVAENPHRVSAIATKLGVRVPSATEQIIKLEALGFVRRGRDPEDSRAVRVHLTPHGQDAIDAANLERNHRMARILSSLTVSEQATLAAALPIIERLNTTALEDR